MAHRHFVDDLGTPWDVWDVRPEWTDRRVSGERRQAGPDDQGVDPPVLEQRRGPDRRKSDSEGLRRVKLANGFSGGWLIFESGDERRRLSPIPAKWDAAAPEYLAELCSRAVAPRARGPRTD